MTKTKRLACLAATICGMAGLGLYATSALAQNCSNLKTTWTDAASCTTTAGVTGYSRGYESPRQVKVYCANGCGNDGARTWAVAQGYTSEGNYVSGCGVSTTGGSTASSPTCSISAVWHQVSVNHL